jgi:hypothetical protein
VVDELPQRRRRPWKIRKTLCWSPKKDGSIQFWASIVGKEIDAFWFPSNDKIRLEWKLDNGYRSVTEREEFILSANSRWREHIVQALQQHWGLSNDEAR